MIAYKVPGLPVTVGLIMIFLAAIMILLGRSKSRLRAKIAQMSTTRIAALGPGQYVEIKGVVSCDQPLKTPDGDIPCVYYHYRIESTYGDSKLRWSHAEAKVVTHEERVPFVLSDSTGSVTVAPQGARFDRPAFLRGHQGVQDDLLARHNLRQPSWPVVWWIRTHGIKLDQEITVLGNVERDESGQLRVAKGRGRFFITPQPKEGLLLSRALASRRYWLASMAFLAIGLAILAAALRSILPDINWR